MRYIAAYGYSFPEAYHKALNLLQEHGTEVPCPDYNTYAHECGATIFVEKANAEPMISKIMIGGHHELQQYAMEVCDGILDFMIGKGENVWEYTYHDRIKDQISFILEELRKNPYSRRAVINVRNNAVDMNNEHPACLQHMQFTIRDGKLNLQVLMRSNDALEAFPMNAFAFIMLQERIADKLMVKVGSYVHTANSFHVYKKDYDKLSDAVNRIVTCDITGHDDLTYNYESFYKDIMEAEIPSIMKMVEDQKRKYGVE